MHQERSPVAAILALGVTQIIGYGTLYYSFSILAADMAKGLGWTTEWVFGALSAALLIGGATAPWAGRLIDVIGAGRVMAAGSLAAAASLAACALAPGGVGFVAALIVMETASNLVLYGAAFALLVQIRPRAAQRSITYLTLIAGFASTVFWPVTTALHERLSWQGVYLVFAGLNLAVCFPLYVWLSLGLSKRGGGTIGQQPSVAGLLAPAQRPACFRLMIVGFAALSLVVAAILVHMIPLLQGLGLGASAAVIGTLFGPSQVLSRLVNMVFGRNLPAIALALIAATLMPASVALLAWTAPSTTGAMVFAVVFGLGNGLFSIVIGTLPLVLFGSEGYGALQGKVMAARLIVAAMAPFAFAFALTAIGAVPSLAVTALLGALGGLSFLSIRVLAGRSG